jgi:hypothetical protein
VTETDGNNKHSDEDRWYSGRKTVTWTGKRQIAADPCLLTGRDRQEDNVEISEEGKGRPWLWGGGTG